MYTHFAFSMQLVAIHYVWQPYNEAETVCICLSVQRQQGNMHKLHYISTSAQIYHLYPGQFIKDDINVSGLLREIFFFYNYILVLTKGMWVTVTDHLDFLASIPYPTLSTMFLINQMFCKRLGSVRNHRQQLSKAICKNVLADMKKQSKELDKEW